MTMMTSKPKTRAFATVGNWNQKFGPELVVFSNADTGIEVRVPEPSSKASHYVRIVVTNAMAEDKVTDDYLEGECELAYWDKAEWQEPEDDVMDVILAAVKRVLEGDDFEVEFGYKAFEE
jgi:hypothetical protein